MAAKIGELELSGSLQGNFRCKWTIERFSSLDFKDGEQEHVSPPFQLEVNTSTIWNLVLTLSKDAEESEDGSKLSYHILCKPVVRNVHIKDINCELLVSLQNTEGEVMSHWNVVPVPVSDEFRIPFFEIMEKDDMLSRLVNDTLVVTIEATYSTLCSNGRSGVQHYGECTPTLKMSEDFKKLWTSKENTDCVISVGGQDIPVHSLILGARSEVFAAMFRHDTLERSAHRVEVIDFEKDAMDSFLEFIYSGSVSDLNFGLALELLRASDKYEVSDLKSYCSNYLMSGLNDENVCHVLADADVHNAEKLRRHAMKYFCENFPSDDDGDFEAKLSLFSQQVLCDIVKRFVEQRRA